MTAVTGRVVVTGGAGLIGSHVVDLLVDEQRRGGVTEIVVFDDMSRGRLVNLASARELGTVTIVQGDVRDPRAVGEVIRGADVVFHLAAIRITRCAEEPRLAMEVLGDGTFNVAEACADAGVRKLVASSSASVYGLADEFPTDERHHPYNNRTLYGALKTFNEGLLRSYHDMAGLPYVGLRYFNVYGPRMDVFGKYTEVLIRWMQRLDEGEAPIIFGDGKATMDFVHVADIARANMLAAASDVTDDVVNVASGVETSLEDLAIALGEAMGVAVAPEFGPERSVNAVPRRLAATDRARDIIGFETEIDLAAGLRSLVAWWRSIDGQVEDRTGAWR